VSGGACTRSATRNAYSDSAACGSLDAANDRCQNGDLVFVKGGNYASVHQSISGGAGRTSMCTIQEAPNETARMKRLNLSGVQWLTVRGVESLTMDCSNGGISCADNTFTPENRRAINVSQGSQNVVVDQVKYGGFNITDSRNVTIRNSELGPCNSWDTSNGGGGGREGCPNGPIQYCDTAIGCSGYNEGHLIERNVFFDYGCDATFFDGVGSDDCHHECMYVSYASDLTVRGNVFRGCANGGNIFHTFSNGGGLFTAHYGYRNYTVENNIFEQSCNNRSSPCGGRLDAASGIGHCNIYPGADLTNVKIRFNTFIGGSMFSLDVPCTQTAGNGLQIIGNLMKRTSTSCGVGWSPELMTHNIWSGTGTCGTNATNVGTTLGSVIVSDANGGDGHLRGAPGSTVADNYVPATVRGGCPASDIDGQPRPTTGFCDAGADER
jgi:pectate lyase